MDFAAERRGMVRRLEEEGHVRSPAVARAMSEVPRELFLDARYRSQAYEDHPMPIGQEQTMSAPHMVAIMCESLQLAPGLRVLEVGTGSGYHAAVTAHAVRPGGRVYTVERMPELAARARENLRAAQTRDVDVVVGDGSRGHAEAAPFDRIYLTCAAPRTPPPLLDQLAENGILLAPIGRHRSELVRTRRSRGSYASEDLGACAFVPLVGAFGDEA